MAHSKTRPAGGSKNSTCGERNPYLPGDSALYHLHKLIFFIFSWWSIFLVRVSSNFLIDSSNSFCFCSLSYSAVSAFNFSSFKPLDLHLIARVPFFVQLLSHVLLKGCLIVRE